MTDRAFEPAGSKPPRFHQHLGRRLRGWLVAGILVVVPVALTAYIVWELVGYFDSLVERWMPSHLNPGTYLPFKIPGYGVVVVAIGLTLIGAVTASLLGRWAVRLGDRMIARTPFISGLYGTIKQVVETVVAQKSNTFRQVVLVEYPRAESWTIAFVCGEAHTEVVRLAGEEMVSLYVPTTPNPTSGFLLFVPRRQVKPLKMSVEEALKLIVSLGIVLPPDRGLEPPTPND